MNMTQEELKTLVKPVVDGMGEIPFGVRIPSNWEAPEGFQLEKFTVENVPVERLTPDNKNGKVLFHLHGGAYVMALLDSSRNAAVAYSKMAGGAEVISVDYRVAPTHHAFAATDDAVAVYKWLLDQGYQAENIVFIGDSAGGNLVLSTTLYLKEHKYPLPKGVIALSPWGCADETLDSRRRNKDKDLLLGTEGMHLGEYVKRDSYFNNVDSKNPLASPIYGDYKGFPNLLIQAGTYEILLDDAVIIAEKAKEAGVNTWFTTYEGMSHDFQLVFMEIEETKKAWAEMERFVKSIFSE